MKSNIVNILCNFLLIFLGASATAAIFIFLFSDLWKYRALDDALKAAEKHEYSVTNYNCVDFSYDAVEELQAKKIDSSIVVIKQDPASPDIHAVIGVWIDPQNGQFISGAEYVGDYNELKNKYGWVK